MSAPTYTVTQSQVQTALRAFLLSVLPAGWEVVEGVDNRVSEPAVPDFVVMTVVGRERLETNGSSYVPPPSNSLNPGTETVVQAYRVTVQLDFHSAVVGYSSDAATMVSTLFRDDIGYQALVASNNLVTPLFADDPKMVPFINAEQQYETRWVLDAVMQVNAGVVTSQQFMLGAPTITIPPPADAAKA